MDIHNLNPDVTDGRLQIARANAIQQYSNVELGLCKIFGDLLGTEPELAGVVFFRITASRARNTIISSLLKRKTAKQYDAYWNGAPNTHKRHGMFTLIGELDGKRNEIVHWQTATNIAISDGGVAASQSLVPPNVWGIKSDSPSISVKDLNAFSVKADFVARSLNMFAIIALNRAQIDVGEQQTWLRIFEQPATYPPPYSHPLSPNYKAPENPHGASPA